MSNRKLSILLLVALLAITSFAQSLEEAHKCTHDSQDLPEPEITQIDEDFDPEGNNNHEGRLLASYNGLRTYAHYGSLSGSMRTFYENEMIPPIVDYLKGALKVKYPVSGSLKFATSSLCGISTPSAIKSGVNADFIWILASDSSASYVANSYTCNMASGTRRPLAGKTTISTRFMGPTSDVLTKEKNMICMMHEVTHILGFSKAMYSRFIDANGRALSGHIKSATLDGLTSIVIDVQPLTTRLRNHYGCSSLKGAYMENTGGSATGGSHFERRHFGLEAMTSGLLYQQPYSEFTLALLEGSGWYVPDYTYADAMAWGKGAGCSWLSGSCTPSQGVNWCSSSARACTDTGRGGGSCGSDARSDGCKYIKPSTSYDCDNSNAKNNARLPALQQFGRGAGGKCFTGTLSTSSGASQTTYCFKPSCTGSAGSYKLNLNIGGKSYACAKKGQLSVSGYKGYINCPDPELFCSTVGLAKCPRNCMGRGTCVSGTCKCNNGYKGADCAINA